MCKRLIALISAVVLCCSLFAVPTFAAEDEVYFDIDYGFLMSAYPEFCGVSFITIDNVLVEYETVAGEFGALEFGRIVGAGSTINVSNVTSYCFSFKGFLPDQEPSVINLLFGTVLQPSSNGTVSLSTNPGSYGASIECVVVRLIYHASDVAFCEYSIARRLRLPGIERFDPSVIRQEGYDAGYQAGVGSTDAYQEGFTDGAASVDQDTIRQEGYDEGYVAGQESIDQDAIRQEGYDEGYAAGESDGYSSGFDAGLQEAADKLYDEANKPIFAYCTLNCTFSHPTWSDVQVLENVPFTLEKGFLSFSSVTYDYIVSEFAGLLDSDFSQLSVTEFYLEWGTEDYAGAAWELPIDAPIYTSVSYLSYPDYSIKVDRYPDQPFDDLPSWTWKIGNVDGRSAFVITSTESPYVKRDDIIRLTFPMAAFGNSLDFFRQMTFSTDIRGNDYGYQYGYVAGYADGLSAVVGDANQKAYDTGYDSGYTLGFSNGKKEGLQITENSDWKSLMLAVVEAPINTFQSLFNFEILGLDMRLAFGSILSVCVLLIIIKKVVL